MLRQKLAAALEDLDDKKLPKETEPGYSSQPTVALYVPEEDGDLEPLKSYKVGS